MQIVNRSGMPIRWFVYNDDDAAPYVLKVSRDKGTLGPDEMVNWTYDRTHLQVEIQSAVRQMIAPTKIPIGSVVIVTPVKAVVLTDEQVELIGVFQNVGPYISSKDAATSAAVGLTILQAVMSAIPTLGTLGSFVGTLAGFLRGGFSQAALDQLPSLADIRTVQESLIGRNEARVAAASIASAWEWYQPFVRKALAAGDGELTDFDRQRFEEGLDDLLGANSDFLKSLQLLQANDSIRRYALASFITAVALRLDWERIDLDRRAAANSLHQVDIDRMLGLADDYERAIAETHKDLEITGLRLLKDSGLTGAPEFEKLRDGFILRYWMGDTSIAGSAQAMLDRVREELGKVKAQVV